MALTKSGFKTNFVSFWRKKNRRRRGEEEKREKRRGRGRREEEEGGTKIKGMELTLDMNSIMDFVWNSRKDYEFQT